MDPRLAHLDAFLTADDSPPRDDTDDHYYEFLCYDCGNFGANGEKGSHVTRVVCCDPETGPMPGDLESGLWICDKCSQ